MSAWDNSCVLTPRLFIIASTTRIGDSMVKDKRNARHDIFCASADCIRMR